MGQYAPNPISLWDGIGPYAAEDAADEAANEADDEATKEDPFVSHFSMMALPEDPESALAEVKKRRGKEMKLPRPPSPSSVTDHLSPTLEIRLYVRRPRRLRRRLHLQSHGHHVSFIILFMSLHHRT